MFFRSRSHADREARLRRKLVNNEMNPVADAVLSVVLLGVSPFIYLFAMIHDKLMFKFLNKTYIYNVSWEVRGMKPFAWYIRSETDVFTILRRSIGP